MWLCTPPSLKRPIRWMALPPSIAACMAFLSGAFSRIEPSRTALEMRVSIW